MGGDDRIKSICRPEADADVICKIDQSGNFLRSVRLEPVASGFGLRFDGVRPDLHRGVDMSVPTGTRVEAMAAGRIRFAGVMRGFGNVVWIDHPGGYLTIYAHLSEIRIREGASVSTGELIGLSGASGDVTAPHLHFEVWRWGRPIDPIPIMGGRPAR